MALQPFPGTKNFFPWGTCFQLLWRCLYHYSITNSFEPNKCRGGSLSQKVHNPDRLTSNQIWFLCVLTTKPLQQGHQFSLPPKISKTSLHPISCNFAGTQLNSSSFIPLLCCMLPCPLQNLDWKMHEGQNPFIGSFSFIGSALQNSYQELKLRIAVKSSTKQSLRWHLLCLSGAASYQTNLGPSKISLILD